MYLGSNSRYQFHSLEIHCCSPEKLQLIAKACEQVEQDVWNPGEDFLTYLKKQSALIYATYNDKVVGFALFDVWLEKNRLVVVGNECMVLKTHQGYGLPSIFISVFTLHIQKINRLRKNKRPYSAVILISATVNYKLMKAFHHYDWLAKRSSFRPDDEIKAVTQAYLRKENYTPLESDNPFFIKAAFPNLTKTTSTIAPPSFVPKNFHPERGDAFLYVCRLEKFLLLNLRARLACFFYRFKFSKNIEPMRQLPQGSIIYSRPSTQS